MAKVFTVVIGHSICLFAVKLLNVIQFEIAMLETPNYQKWHMFEMWHVTLKSQIYDMNRLTASERRGKNYSVPQ